MAQVKYKPAWKSKTVWVNTMISIIGVIEASDLSVIIPDHYNGIFLACLGILGILLRVVTTEPVSVRGA